MLCRMPGEMPFCKISGKRTCFVKYTLVKLWKVCLVKCRCAKTRRKRTCFVKYAWRNTERGHAWSSMPGEMPFSKNKLKENMLCHLCQVCLVKCRCAETRRKRTCFVKYAWWNAVLQDKRKENVLCQIRPDRMPSCKREHVCQVGLVKCPFAKASWKRTCFVKYAWWNAVLQDKLKENVLCQVCLVKCRFAKRSWKRTCSVKLCQVCLVKCRFAKRSWKRTCFVIFVKYAWWNAVVQKHAEREHALSNMPGEMPFCKISGKRTCFVIFVKYAWWSAVLQKQARRLSSIPDGMPVCKNMLKENMLCQVGLVKGLFAR